MYYLPAINNALDNNNLIEINNIMTDIPNNIHDYDNIMLELNDRINDVLQDISTAQKEQTSFWGNYLKRIKYFPYYSLINGDEEFFNEYVYTKFPIQNYHQIIHILIRDLKNLVFENNFRVYNMILLYYKQATGQEIYTESCMLIEKLLLIITKANKLNKTNILELTDKFIEIHPILRNLIPDLLVNNIVKRPFNTYGEFDFTENELYLMRHINKSDLVQPTFNALLDNNGIYYKKYTILFNKLIRKDDTKYEFKCSPGNFLKIVESKNDQMMDYLNYNINIQNGSLYDHAFTQLHCQNKINIIYKILEQSQIWYTSMLYFHKYMIVYIVLLSKTIHITGGKTRNILDIFKNILDGQTKNLSVYDNTKLLQDFVANHEDLIIDSINGQIWSHKSHLFFPLKLKCLVRTFILSLKGLGRIVPKPLIRMIINYIVYL